MNKHEQLAFDWVPPAARPEPKPAVRLEQTCLPNMGEISPPTRPRKPSAILPVPKPLPEAVGNGSFGEDEFGPIRPGPEEVRAITEYHAEKLVALLEQLEEINRTIKANGVADHAAPVQKDRVESAYHAGIALYAEDFGQPAADRLDAFVRQQIGLKR